MGDGPLADSPAGDAGLDAPLSKKHVFVTSKAFNGDLKTAGNGADGLQGADKLCASAATAAGLSGTWKAYVSGTVNGATSNAPDRIADVGPWYLLDGTLAVATKAQLSAAISHAIGVDELGSTGPGAVWTGTRLGTYTQACENPGGDSWASADQGAQGTGGSALDATEWSAGTSTLGAPNALAMCSDGSLHLYCFEQ
jgi:hypothetical protein